MNCADVRHEFSAMLDGELTPETRAAVEVHLSECSECLRELDKLKRVDALYHALPRQHAPDGFEERVSASLKPAVIQFRRQERRFATRRLWPLMAAAAAMLVILGGVLLQLETKQESFDIASNPEAVAEQDAEDMPEHIKQQLRALGYLEDDTDLEGDASDELAKPVREITQPMGNMPRKTVRTSGVRTNSTIPALFPA